VGCTAGIPLSTSWAALRGPPAAIRKYVKGKSLLRQKAPGLVRATSPLGRQPNVPGSTLRPKLSMRKRAVLPSATTRKAACKVCSLRRRWRGPPTTPPDVKVVDLSGPAAQAARSNCSHSAKVANYRLATLAGTRVVQTGMGCICDDLVLWCDVGCKTTPAGRIQRR